jgi:hypothetical protein
MRTAPLAGAAVAALGLVLAALASPWFLILAAAGAALAAIALLRR